jgi:hypothetical protein
MHQQNMNLHEQSNTKKTRTGTKKPKKRMDPTMMSIYKDLQQTIDADTGNGCTTYLTKKNHMPIRPRPDDNPGQHTSSKRRERVVIKSAARRLDAATLGNRRGAPPLLNCSIDRRSHRSPPCLRCAARSVKSGEREGKVRGAF